MFFFPNQIESNQAHSHAHKAVMLKCMQQLSSVKSTHALRERAREEQKEFAVREGVGERDVPASPVLTDMVGCDFLKDLNTKSTVGSSCFGSLVSSCCRK